jgi:hypothetical protein
MSNYDVVILRDGEALSGNVLTKNFTIKTSYADLIIEKNKIMHIHFENLPQFPRDEVYLTTMDKIKGKLLLNEVSFKIGATAQIVNIETNKMHTIMFLKNISS